MALTLYWAGSTAAAGLNRFNFNYGPNWKVAAWNKPTTQWLASATGPNPGDTIYVGSQFVALSPILYGGYSGGVTSGTWLINGGTAGSASGTTATNSLTYVTIDVSSPGTATGTSYYPFPYFGGGITGDTYNYVVNVMGQDTTDYTGFTASYSSLGLNLKVGYNVAVTTTGRINPFYDIGGTDQNGYPNYSVVNLNFTPSKVVSGGASGPSAGACQTYLYFGVPYYNRNGGGNVTINGGMFNAVSYNDLSSNYGPVSRPLAIQMNRCVVGSSNFNNCDLVIDKSCTFGTLNVNPTDMPYYPIQRNRGFDGKGIIVSGLFDTSTAYNLMGWATPSVTASPYQSGIYMYPQYTTRASDTLYNYTPSVIISTPDDGTTFTSQVLQIISESGLSGAGSSTVKKPWNVQFFGDSVITTMVAQGANISALPGVANNKKVQITNLTLAEFSILDLQRAPNFDNWYFGTISNGTVVGGINFADDTSRIIGSAGVRLYNTQIGISQFDFRNSTYTVDVSANLSPYFGQAGPSIPGLGGAGAGQIG